jgi:anthranilate phosphoribosyltransferase
MRASSVRKSKSKKTGSKRSISELIEWFDKTDTGEYLEKMPEVEFDIDIKPTLKGFLARLTRGQNLSRNQASQLLDALLDSEATDAQIAAVLTALTVKGETVDELAGMASSLRARAVRVNCCHQTFIDTAGTGSSGAKTFNVSTAAAFVIAGAGLPVAKHGNRAASSRSGSADVLTALGVNISAAPQLSENCLDEIGICFMFAPLYHGATARVAAIRRELGIHTTFNLLGPLSNPAGAPRQIIGVFRKDLVERLARTLAALGAERAWVVHGEDGLDEITITGRTLVAQAHKGKVETFEIGPGDFGLSQGSLDHMRGGDAETNARVISEVLAGTRRDEARSLVVANAAAALLVGGLADTLLAGARAAEESIDQGAARDKLERLIFLTNAV